ncbi:MAG: DNA-binding protein [bacterium]|nr:DNA-binding protein [bacterium]MDT8396446.1 DNA-binding protein [bacterium]
MRVEQGRAFIGRLPSGADLLESLTAVCRYENVRFGVVTAIGAVSSARLGYYKQDEQEYMECLNIEKGLEIVSCLGNMSLKEGEIFVHTHVILSDKEGRCYGGHLMPGTRVFAAEYCIRELVGKPYSREWDAVTGLALWPQE